MILDWAVRALLSLAVVLSASIPAAAQGIDAGSDGSDGAFVFVQDTGPGAVANTMTIDLALAATGVDGMGQPITWQTPSPVPGRGVYDPELWAVVFKYSSVDVPAGKVIRFRNHGARAPVVWLSQTLVTIRGIVTLTPTGSAPFVAWPEPGPGGFRGGGPSTSSGFTPGFGPGGGESTQLAQNGNYAGPGVFNYAGPSYGSPTIFPLLGGSGGAGSSNGDPGAAGGGAILIAANDRIEVVLNGRVSSRAGWFGIGTFGSGGAIRLVSNVIALPSTLSLDAYNTLTSNGRVRLEANQFQGILVTSPDPSIGAPGPLFPGPSTPTVRVVSVTIGGQTHAVPADPRASFSFPQADVLAQAAGSAQLQIEARNVAPGRICRVRVANPRGSGALWVDSTPLTGTAALSTATATVALVTGLHVLQVRVVL